MEPMVVIQPPYDQLILDNTKRSTYALCPRKFYWHHYRGLVSKQGSDAIRYGATWHAVLEGYYKTIKELGWQAKDTAVANGGLRAKEVWNEQSKDLIYIGDYRTFESCMESFLQYLVFFQMDQSIVEVVDTEQVFELPLTIDENDWWYDAYQYQDLPKIIFTGRIDKVIKLSGLYWTVEHKSTGQAMDQQVQRLNRLAQIMGYSWAGKKLYSFDVAGSLVTIHRIYAGKLKDGGYGKLSIDFRRVPQIFTPADISQWKHSFFYTGSRILQSLHLDEWPMNHDACFQYGQCAYFRLCEQAHRPLNDVITDGFIYKPWDVRTENAD